MKELEILYELQIMMNNYDKVILLANDEPNIFLMANILSEVVCQKKILFLSVFITGRVEDESCCNVDWFQLDKETCEILKKLYYTYEFSDKFKIYSSCVGFGTIWNYVKNGLLSPEEAISVLLK